MPAEPDADHTTGGVSRRAAVTAAVTAAVWAAPVISVVATAPAFAASGAVSLSIASPASSTDAYLGSGGVTQQFTAQLVSTAGAATSSLAGRVVTFSLAADDTSWLTLGAGGSQVTTATAVVDANGRASVTVTFNTAVLPASIPASVTLTATTPTAPTPVVWTITYRVGTAGATPQRGATSIVASRQAGTTGASVLAIRNGRLYGWGVNTSGQLGQGASAAPSYRTPQRIDAGSLAGKTVVAVDCHSGHVLALAADNTLHAFGAATNGQLGDGVAYPSGATSPVPVAVDRSGALNGKTIVAVATSSAHSVALASDGSAYAWGARQNGRLGDGGSLSGIQNVPVAVAMPPETVGGATAPARFTAVVAVLAVTIALSSTGRVYAWGAASSQGSHGLGTVGGSDVLRPTLVAGAIAGKTIVAIRAGGGHVLALGDDGTVYGWGRNDTGQVLPGSTDTQFSPVVVPNTGPAAGAFRVLGIAAGVNHSQAIAVGSTPGSTVRLGWGAQTVGQQGNAVDTVTTALGGPTAIPEPAGSSLAGTTLAGLSAGSASTFAIAADGTLHAWGSDLSGSLGDDATIGNKSIPVRVAALP